MKKIWLFPFSLFLLFACAGPKKAQNNLSANPVVVDGKLWSSLFQQKAGEYKALCIQAYQLAQLRLDQAIQSGSSKPLAVITDIDETFLDNSPYAVREALLGKDYEANTWKDWTSKGIADTICGALDFFRYAASKNVAIYYITNRDEAERTGTLNNLKLFKFPQADNDHLIMRQTTSSKESRRMQVAAKYDIVLLLGDNLGDFSDVFDKKTTEQRNEQVQLLRKEFGKRFIVLPNPAYGGWEESIYLNKRDWSAAQKDSLVKASVKSY